ncbi:MAG: GNAT family N-acetyltransferase [Cytophagales bacterium]|nr:GNAT family N-acetyltransferase [Cytophagales bacterium]
MSFLFSEIAPSERLVYEKLDLSNAMNAVDLFQGDPDEFIPAHYKDKTLLVEYLECQKNIPVYSHKVSGQDWLFKLKSGEYIGVISIFDLSRETNNQRNKLCSIGFSTHPKYRGQYLTLEAINQLCGYIFEKFEMEVILAYTSPKNLACLELLLRAGFVEAKNKYIDPNLAYFERKP